MRVLVAPMAVQWGPDVLTAAYTLVHAESLSHHACFLVFIPAVLTELDAADKIIIDGADFYPAH